MRYDPDESFDAKLSAAQAAAEKWKKLYEEQLERNSRLFYVIAIGTTIIENKPGLWLGRLCTNCGGIHHPKAVTLK